MARFEPNVIYGQAPIREYKDLVIREDDRILTQKLLLSENLGHF